MAEGLTVRWARKDWRGSSRRSEGAGDERASTLGESVSDTLAGSGEGSFPEDTSRDEVDDSDVSELSAIPASFGSDVGKEGMGEATGEDAHRRVVLEL